MCTDFGLIDIFFFRDNDGSQKITVDQLTLDMALHWRHNGHDSVSNHQPHGCLLNRLFRRRSRKCQSSAPLAFVRGIHRRPVNSPHKWPVTRKMFPFDDVIMVWSNMTPYRLQFRSNDSRIELLSDWNPTQLFRILLKRNMNILWN